MATPVVRKMLGTDKKNPGISDDWWVDNDFLPTKAAKVSAETYTALMVKIAAREQESMRQQRIAENRAASAKRKARGQSALRAEAHNLLGHCPDAWWNLLKEQSPPTALVVLTPDAASALRHTCRSLLKGHHANRAQEIRELLAEARAALKFSDRRKAEGEASALLIQRVVAYPFLARRMIRLLILERWEKRWNDGQQTYFYIDTWAERASSSKSNYWAEEDDEPYQPPPWDIKSREPPAVLRKKKFNLHATPESTMGTPRGVERKLGNERDDGEALLERERGVRERAAERDRKRDARVHDLCCLEALMGALRACGEGLAAQWPAKGGSERYDLYATPPTREAATMAFMDPVAFKESEKKRVADEEAAEAEKLRLRGEAGPDGFPASEEEVGCEFFVQMMSPWKGPRASVAMAAAKEISREYAALKEKGQEEARKIMRKKKGILDASDIGGLPEGFEGNVGDLFAAWGAPTELTEAEQKQKEKDEQEKAEKLAKEKEAREAKAIEECSEEDMKEWEALNEKGKKEDPMYEPVRLVEWLDAREAEERRLREEAEEAALMDRELRSSNDQLCAWRERQRLKLTCRSSGDALAILLGDAANTLAALASAERIYNDPEVWPHREVFPLPLVLHKRIEVFDASVFGARALLHKGELRALGQKSGARFYADFDAHAADAVPQVIAEFGAKRGRWKAFLHSLRAPLPAVEYDEAHKFLVGRGLREESDRSVSLELLEEMASIAQESRNEHLANTGVPMRPLLAWCVRGSDPVGGVYTPSEVAPPFALCRWAMRPDPRSTAGANNAEGGGGGGGGGAAAAAGGAAGEASKGRAAAVERSSTSTSTTSTSTSRPGTAASNAGSAVGGRSRPATAIDDETSPAALEALELGLLADSVAVDLILDTGASQMEREQLFNMTGATKNFAKVDAGCYVPRVFLYRAEDGIKDMGPAPEPPPAPVDEFGNPIVEEYDEDGNLIETSFEVGGETGHHLDGEAAGGTAGTGGERPESSAASTGRPPSGNQLQQEGGAPPASWQSLSRGGTAKVVEEEEEEPLPWENLKPFVLEADEAVSYGVEHGAPAPPTPLEPPRLELFDWRTPTDAALLLGDSDEAQLMYPEESLTEADVAGWLNDEIPKGKDSRPDKKKGKKKGKKQDDAASDDILAALEPVEVLPDPNKPAMFTYRGAAEEEDGGADAGAGGFGGFGGGGADDEEEDGGVLVEARVKGKGRTTHELRKEVPATLHMLFVDDKSDDRAAEEEEAARKAAEAEARRKRSASRGKKGKRFGGGRKKKK